MERSISRIVIALCVLSSHSVAVADAPVPRYTVTDLGALGDEIDVGYNGWGINNKGQVAGKADGHACLWSEGKRIVIGPLDHIDSRAYDINDQGQVVGHMAGSATYHSFLWQNGRLTDIGASKGWSDVNTINGASKGWSDANAINDKGQIAGTADVVGGYHHAVLWEKDWMRDLGTLGSHLGVGTGINNHGDVVGFCGTTDKGHQLGFLWSGGKMKSLGTMPGFTDYAPNAINDNNQITGWAFSFDMQTHASVGPDRAFLWEKGKMRELGTLGGHDSHAYGINSLGQVVGWADSAQEQRVAFLFEDGKMLDLNTLIPALKDASLLDTLSRHLSMALGINDHGQIVALSGTVNNITHLYLLTPIQNNGGPAHG